MKEKIIKMYIKKLTKTDIINFAKKQNIVLMPNETNFIYETIKNKYDVIIDNPLAILQYSKDKVRPIVYDKIYELYTIYYPQLRQFLNDH